MDNKSCEHCKHFIGAGDWNLCCDLRYDLCYKNTTACNQYEGVEGEGEKEEENRRMTRQNYCDQLSALGYNPDGTPKEK